MIFTELIPASSTQVKGYFYGPNVRSFHTYTYQEVEGLRHAITSVTYYLADVLRAQGWVLPDLWKYDSFALLIPQHVLLSSKGLAGLDYPNEHHFFSRGSRGKQRQAAMIYSEIIYTPRPYTVTQRLGATRLHWAKTPFTVSTRHWYKRDHARFKAFMELRERAHDFDPYPKEVPEA